MSLYLNYRAYTLTIELKPKLYNQLHLLRNTYLKICKEKSQMNRVNNEKYTFETSRTLNDATVSFNTGFILFSISSLFSNRSSFCHENILYRIKYSPNWYLSNSGNLFTIAFLKAVGRDPKLNLEPSKVWKPNIKHILQTSFDTISKQKMLKIPAGFLLWTFSIWLPKVLSLNPAGISQEK